MELTQGIFQGDPVWFSTAFYGVAGSVRTTGYSGTVGCRNWRSGVVTGLSGSAWLVGCSGTFILRRRYSFEVVIGNLGAWL